MDHYRQIPIIYDWAGGAAPLASPLTRAVEDWQYIRVSTWFAVAAPTRAAMQRQFVMWSMWLPLVWRDS